MTKITDVEASLEQFKSVSLAYQKETSNRFHRMQESIDKNKADADKQFSELLQLLKALQPPTTLPTTIPRFEENSGQCFSSDEVEKEELILTSAVDKGDFTRPIFAVKEDLGQKLIDDLDEPLMMLEPNGMISVVKIGHGGRYISDISLGGGPPPRYLAIGNLAGRLKKVEGGSPPRNRYIAAKTDLSLKGGRPPRYRRAIFTTLGMINKNEFAVVAPVVAVAPIAAPIAVAPFVVAPIVVAPVILVVVAPVEPSFVPLGR
ncbi:hypothetical protein Tco_0482097 [Tanacetum coccineum]